MGNQLRFTAEQYAVLQAKRGSPQAAAPIIKPSVVERNQALGRLKDGEKNKTEARFEAEYLLPRKLVGEILWYEFELIKIKIAKNTHITIDWFLMDAKRQLLAIDTKGSRHNVEDDARAKTKVAAQLCPWEFFFAFPIESGGWDIEKVGL